MSMKMTHQKTEWERLDPYDRYRNDPAFHVLVDMLHSHMEQCSYTPTELREACHLAACMYEERRVRPMLIDPKEPFKWNTRQNNYSDGDGMPAPEQVKE